MGNHVRTEMAPVEVPFALAVPFPLSNAQSGKNLLGVKHALDHFRLSKQ